MPLAIHEIFRPISQKWIKSGLMANKKKQKRNFQSKEAERSE